MTTLFTFDLVRAQPQAFELALLAGGIEGGRSLAGDAGAIDFSAGGLWAAKYKNGTLLTKYQHLYLNQLAGLLNSRTRAILVPFATDIMMPTSPFLGGGPQVEVRVPHSDGTPFDDQSLYQQPSVTASMSGAAALNAGTVNILVSLGDKLYGGEIFSIQHPTKNWRCYCITEIDATIDNGNGTFTYQVAITPPLREATSGGEAAKFDRPLCYMRMQPSGVISWPVQDYWVGKGDFAFIEAF